MRAVVTAMLVLALTGTADAQVTDGAGLLRAMHDKYGEKWYQTVVFVQNNTLYGPDGKLSGHSQWDHHFSLPGKLRIDFLPDPTDANAPTRATGVLLANDSQYVFTNGKITSRSQRFLSLLLLAFDVYLLPPDTTISRIRGLGFDLAQFHADQWQGRPVFVAGAKAGDLKSRQFWVDQEFLYPVRVIEPADAQHVRDVQFNKYQRLGDGWIAPEVMMYLDGTPQRLEEYQDPRADVPVDPVLFDPARIEN